MMMMIFKDISMLVLLKYLKLIPLHATLPIRFKCPFHDSKSGLSADINRQNKIWCWSCGKAFDTITVYQKITGKDFAQSFTDLTNFYQSAEYQELTQAKSASAFTCNESFKLSNNENKALNNFANNNLHLDTILAIWDEISHFYQKQLWATPAALDYLLRKRQLNPLLIKEFQIGFANKNNQNLLNYLENQQADLMPYYAVDLLRKNPKFSYDGCLNCWLIPVFDENGQIIHYYRHHYPAELPYRPKYQALRNLTNQTIFSIPYGFHYAKKAILDTKTAILHEGFFDVLQSYQNQIKNVIGLITVSNNFSPFILDFFKKYQIKVILGLDNDETGLKTAHRLSQQLKRLNIENYIKTIPNHDCKDADELLRKYGLKTYQKIYLESK
ncbi:MAG: toprim domain-containing protein [Candidatus Phytoplasma australasiaticum]|uniref:toprim domain-containing protein n=1 Tax=Candidatus Phytoplasma australasiaticum TaxID=2754999 RepID=UPI002713A099|nr:toprim domain-containing protein [Sweet potato little leaf phytoplasma]MDO8008950.1 toprim domain-containing protein [Sweet potato little leaf phytoplasma]MDV3180044.1 toprim domain-containing protein [Candidatus Phytoplasma australasiaticum]MDV3199895.1 toprim domain-containing protein [Candidatus Phytoplasma australasiaticum]